MSLIKACKKGSAVLIEKEIKKGNDGINTSYTDDQGHTISPLTWCCINDYLSLVELLVKKGANTNQHFFNEQNEEISVIDWACQKNNALLVKILLDHKANFTYKTFEIAKSNKSNEILYLLSRYLKEAISQYYQSNVYDAYKSIDFSRNSNNIYLFSFNTGQANFIAIRRNNKIVIIDAGLTSSEVLPYFDTSIKKMEEGKAACDKLIDEINKFKQNPGKVMNLFTTNLRAEPRGSYNNLTNLIREYFKDDVERINEIKDAKIVEKKIENEKDIIDTINSYKEKFETQYQDKKKHAFRFLFQSNSIVEAVFITHPHKDHYSLISYIKNQYNDSFANTNYYLGGLEADWNDEETKKLISEIKKNAHANIKYYGGEYESDRFTFLNDTQFKIWGQSNTKDSNDTNENSNIAIRDMNNKNQLSLIISFYYKDIKILFTGDAEGNVLERIKIDKPTVDKKIEKRQQFISFMDKIEKLIMQGRIERKNIIKDVKSQLNAFLKVIKNPNNKEKYEKYINEMLDIENSLIVYEPHHGSMTEGSHEIYNYLHAQDQKQFFFISSYPESKDFLPKESSVCVNRESKHVKTKLHPIVYATKENIPTMSMTTNPVYTTGSAPNGVYLLKIDDNKVDLLNLDDKKPKWESLKS